jgi:hypothetical protein
MNSVAMPLHIYLCIRSIQRGLLALQAACLRNHVCLAGMGRAPRPTRRDSHSCSLSLGASIEGEGQYAAVSFLGPRQAGWARWGERGASRSVRVSFPAGGGGEWAWRRGPRTRSCPGHWQVSHLHCHYQRPITLAGDHRMRSLRSSLHGLRREQCNPTALRADRSVEQVAGALLVVHDGDLHMAAGLHGACSVPHAARSARQQSTCGITAHSGQVSRRPVVVGGRSLRL